MTSDFPLALHILGFLTASEGKPLTSEILAETYGTSPVVVRRVLIKLKESGLVKSQRGAGGGSVLAKDPVGISLREVYESVHGDLAILPRAPGNSGPVSEVISRYVNELFEKAEAALLADLENTTIVDLDSQCRAEICEFLCRDKE